MTVGEVSSAILYSMNHIETSFVVRIPQHNEAAQHATPELRNVTTITYNNEPKRIP